MSDISQKNQPKKMGLGRGLGSLLGAEKSAPAQIVQKAPAPAVARPTVAPPAPKVTFNKPALEFDEKKEAPISNDKRIWMLPVEKIKANHDQPRKRFDAEKLKELSASIKEKGVLQPILVRKLGENYQIIAGERRWRAAQAAGVLEVPVIIREESDQAAYEIALIENIQRHDLNPIEEAKAYQVLVASYNLSHDQIAQKVSRERASVTNTLRLLVLPEPIQKMVVEGLLSQGHAKAILAVESPADQTKLAQQAVTEKLSVRVVERLAKAYGKTKEAPLEKIKVADQLAKNLAEELQKSLGTKVSIHYDNGKGHVQISFFTNEQLTQIVEKLKN